MAPTRWLTGPATGARLAELRLRRKGLQMPRVHHGPFLVVGPNVATGVRVQPGDDIWTLSTGFVNFGSRFFGILPPILDADGDGNSWSTPSTYPAPNLYKNSLIYNVGGHLYQGGVNRANPMVTGGEVVLRANDEDAADNTGGHGTSGWSVDVWHTSPDITPRPRGDPNLSITNIEPVQAIQRADNSVQLIAGKRTVVRVYVASGISDGTNHGAGANVQPNVTGFLTVVGVDTAAVLATVFPFNAGGAINAQPGTAINRNVADHSLNFELPATALTGLVRLDVRTFVQGHQADPPSSGWGAVRNLTLSFESRPPQQVLPVLIRDARRGTVAPSMAGFAGSLQGARSRYPIAEGGFVTNAPLALTSNDDLTMLGGWQSLILRLTTTILLGDPRGGVRCGVVPNDPSYALNGIGTANYFLNVPSFVARVGLQGTFAHEMGHAFGLNHAPCCIPPGEAPDPRLPGVTDDTGMDVASHTVIPAGRGEIMSYCGDTSACPGPTRWPSTAFWDAIRSHPPI